MKICGITSVAIAEATVAAGADAIGFAFIPTSARRIDAVSARAIVAKLPPFVASVGLFANASAAEVAAVVAECPLSYLQFNGDESEAFCCSFGRPYLRAVAARGEFFAARYEREFASAAGFLLDTPPAPGATVPGGSGKSFDWSLFPRTATRPWILAGGLNADNVSAAIRSTRPYGVDVSSGVEITRGVKDPQRIVRFIEEVRQVERELAVA